MRNILDMILLSRLRGYVHKATLKKPNVADKLLGKLSPTKMHGTSTSFGLKEIERVQIAETGESSVGFSSPVLKIVPRATTSAKYGTIMMYLG